MLYALKIKNKYKCIKISLYVNVCRFLQLVVLPWFYDNVYSNFFIFEFEDG